jgi:hypothetical protein
MSASFACPKDPHATIMSETSEARLAYILWHLAVLLLLL